MIRLQYFFARAGNQIWILWWSREDTWLACTTDTPLQGIEVVIDCFFEIFFCQWWSPWRPCLPWLCPPQASCMESCPCPAHTKSFSTSSSLMIFLSGFCSPSWLVLPGWMPKRSRIQQPRRNLPPMRKPSHQQRSRCLAHALCSTRLARTACRTAVGILTVSVHMQACLCCFFYSHLETPTVATSNSNSPQETGQLLRRGKGRLKAQAPLLMRNGIAGTRPAWANDPGVQDF